MRRARYLTLPVLALFLLAPFQNCSQGGFQSNLSISTSDSIEQPLQNEEDDSTPPDDETVPPDVEDPPVVVTPPIVTPPVAGSPSIVSAIRNSSGSVTISGSNFGVKSQAAPTFFQPFTALSAGATPTAAGFESWVNRGGEAVTMADGIGGGSLRCDPGVANNAFPHIGKYLPANTLEMRLSFYFKLYGSSASPSVQLKFARAGVHVAGQDGSEDYASSNAKYYGSLFLGGDNRLYQNSAHAEWRTAGGVISSYYPDDGGAGSPGIPVSSQPTADTSQWVFAEVYYKFNDVGVANGVYKIALNGYVWQNRTTTQLRTDANQYINYIQPIPSIDLSNPNDFDYAISRVHIDVGPQSQAQVYLGNASTSAAVTKKFILPATAWTNDSINAGHATNIPAGYNYIYVTNTQGITNSAGIALSSQ